MCTHTRYRIKGRQYTPQGWKPFTKVLDNVDELDYTDTLIYTDITKVQCGHCIECKLSTAKEKAFRGIKEAKYHEHNIMITFTYDDEHLPRTTGIDPKTGEIIQSSTLVPEHYVKFFKRLRKKIGKFRYMICGEYGSDDEYIDSHGNQRKATERPHYHAILFGAKFEDMVFDRWKRCEWNPKIKNALYKSKIATKTWGMGHVDLNEVNYETIRYVAGYVVKKYSGDMADEEYTIRGRIPPFYHCSTRPGIGYQYFQDNKEKFMKEQPQYAVTKKGLKKIKSRYFDKLIEKENPERWEEIKEERKIKSNQAWANILNKTDISKKEYIDNSDSKAEFKNRFFKMRK